MASFQLKKPIQESLPAANCQNDKHTTAQKDRQADAKQVVTGKSKKHLTQVILPRVRIEVKKQSRERNNDPGEESSYAP